MQSLDKLITYTGGLYSASLLIGGLSLALVAPIPIQAVLKVLVPLCGGLLLGDYLLGPKLLHPNSKPSKRWGELGWLWHPYRWLVRELGQWVQYVPILSTGLRVAIALSVPAVGIGVLGLGGLPVVWVWNAIASYPAFWIFAFLGVEQAAFIHAVIHELAKQVWAQMRPVQAPPEAPTHVEPEQEGVHVLQMLLNSAVDKQGCVCYRCGAVHQYLRHYPYSAGLHRDWCPVPELSEFLRQVEASKDTVEI